MSWIVNAEKTRTYNPHLGLELLFISGGSDGSRQIRICGDNIDLEFTASTIDAPITQEELAALGLSDAMVWCVWGKPTDFNPEERALIVDALCATKRGHGSNIWETPYFVRFGLKGELRNADLTSAQMPTELCSVGALYRAEGSL